MTPFPTQSNVIAALRSFLLDVLPAGTVVRTAQQNRVSEPQQGDFVIMTPLRMTRLRTNVSSDADVRFQGSVSGNVLTVSSVTFGKIIPGATLFGSGVADGTQIVAQLSGPTGGAGTYSVGGNPQTVGAEVLATGARLIEMGTEVAVQLDFHTADALGAGDMAATVSTLFRDSFAVDQFANQSPNYGVVPLHADDPRQAPFVNAEQQYETRWTVDALLQANIVVSIPQQYADSETLTVISVEAAYPP